MRRNPALAWLAMLLLITSGCARYQKQVDVADLTHGPVDNVDILTRDGLVYHLDDGFVDAREIRGTGLVFAESDSGSVFAGAIPTEDVVLVQVSCRDALGVWLTAAAVVSLVVVVAAADEGQEGRITIYQPPGIWGSCPFVYAFDGARYRLDAEPFVGSICRELAQTSQCILPHLAAHGGTLDVALCNQALESQYVDNVRLLHVEHPAGTRLVADAMTGLHSVGDIHPVTAARDEAGRDITHLLAKADGQHWSTDLTRVDPDDPTTFVDEIICEFPRPATAAGSTVIVELVNSDLAEFAVHKLLALCGPRRIDWYRDLAVDPRQRLLLLGWMLREGCLAVDVWDGGQWQRQGLVPQVGGAVTVARALRLTTDEVEAASSTLRVRLQGAAGLWMIDSVSLGRASDVTPVGTPLDVTSFTSTIAGLDAAAVAESDQVYLPLYPDDWAVLQFAAPARPATGARTYVLEAGGHYYHWPTATGSNDQRDLVDAVLREPLLGSRLFLAEWLTVHRDIPTPEPPPTLPSPASPAIHPLANHR